MPRAFDGSGLDASGRVVREVEQTIDARRGRGSPLDTMTRARVGGALNDPLNDVRVHTDATAAALARAVSARAFTTGSDIFFGAGERPGGALLAHELAHVVQQRGAPSRGPMVVSQPGDAAEVQAETFARDV